jgi:hypothetical protein
VSAPTDAHEERVVHLETLAGLAGCVREADLGRGVVPDVARVDLLRRRLIVADAKATEAAGCEETHRRLRKYMRATRHWIAHGYAVRVVVCHSPPASAWQARLRQDALVCGLRVSDGGTCRVGPLEALCWVDLEESTMTAPPCTIPLGGRSHC